MQLIVRVSDSTYMGQIFKAVYTLALFSFLRLSNLVPHAAKLYSPLYQLAREDIILTPLGIQLLVKWSNTLQDRNTVKILKIPSLGTNPTPGSSNSPLFQYKKSLAWYPMTDTQVRTHFKGVLKKLNLPDSNLTFYAFQRSGATYAFNSNVDIQEIQSHGTWMSECVWKYITLDHDASHQVALTFQWQLHSPTNTTP